MQLSPDDRRLIGECLQRLCRDLATQYFARPEAPCPPPAFQAAFARLVEQGVLNTTDTPGAGLWEHPDAPEALALTLDTLVTLGACNAALAFSLHRAALARCLLARLGVAVPAAPLALCLHGHHGLGRGELAHWWQGRAADMTLLAQVFDATTPRLALMPDNAAAVLCPVFAAGALQWRRCAVPPLAAGSHGLDELGLGQVVAAGEVVAESGPALARALWHAEWLGLLAIQQGVAQAALARAREYAALRFQGGQRIAQHPAVQALLLSQRTALADSAAFLRAQTLSSAAFGALLLARNRLQDGLAEAVNAAMQIFGGIGYMRDSGLEKAFRDVYQLRYQSGGPLDMQQLAAHWEDPS